LLAASTKDDVIHELDREGERRYSLPAYASGCASLLFSPNGRYLLAGHTVDLLKLWDANTGEQVLTGRYLPWGFARDGKHIAGGNRDGVSFCDLVAPEALRPLTGNRAWVEKRAWSRDNRHFVTLDTRFEVRTWDATRGVTVGEFPAPPR
jgi:WD40 repeat protein